MVEGIERVTADDLHRVARDLFDSHRIALTVLGSLDGFKIGREELVC